MKKLILSAVLFTGLAFGVKAQNTTSSSDGGIKPTSGEITLEANVNLLNGNVNLSNSLNQIRGRYFLSDDMAFRLGTNIRYHSDDPEVNIKTNTFEFSLAPGIEKHFAGTNRLSPYVGADLLFGFKRSHFEDTNRHGNVVKTEIEGGWEDGAERGNFLIGLAGVAGFDFYVAKHLYLGYELGLELNSVKSSEIEITRTFDDGEIRTETFGGNSNFNFGPNVRNGIRVGFVF